MAPTKKERGRPKSDLPKRSAFRHDEGDIESFRDAAATCGMTWQEWALATLRAEAKRAVHVPMVKRSGVKS